MPAATSEAVPSGPYVPPPAHGPRTLQIGISRRWWFRGVLGLALLGAVLGGQGWLRALFAGRPPSVVDYVVTPTLLSVTLEEEGELRPKDYIEIKSELEGNPKIIWLVPESTAVKAGDKLVVLETDQLEERVAQAKNEVNRVENALKAALSERDVTRSDNETRLRKAQIDLELATLDLRGYLEGEFPRELQRIQIEIKQTEIEVEQKTEDLRKNQEHHAKGYVSSGKIRELTHALERACMTLEKLHHERAILEQYTRVKAEKQRRNELQRAEEELERERQRAASRLEQAEARVMEHENSLALNRQKLDRLMRQLEKGTLYAPSDGVVKYGSPRGSRWDWRRIAVGEPVSSGQTILTLPDTSQMIVSLRIHEADRHKVREGLACLVKVPAVPGASLRGVLSKIDKFASSQDSWLNPDLKEHDAEISLDATDLPISPGDTAQITILIEDVVDALAVPVQCVYARGDKHFVFRRTGRSVSAVEVELGRSSTTLVEIRAGINPNDRILLQVSDRELPLLPAADPPPVSPVGTPDASTNSVPVSAVYENRLLGNFFLPKRRSAAMERHALTDEHGLMGERGL